MKKNLKKVLSLIMILMLSFSLVACNGTSGGDSDSATEAPSSTDDGGDTDDATEEPADEDAE